MQSVGKKKKVVILNIEEILPQLTFCHIFMLQKLAFGMLVTEILFH